MGKTRFSFPPSLSLSLSSLLLLSFLLSLLPRSFYGLSNTLRCLFIQRLELTSSPSQVASKLSISRRQTKMKVISHGNSMKLSTLIHSIGSMVTTQALYRLLSLPNSSSSYDKERSISRPIAHWLPPLPPLLPMLLERVRNV